MGLREDLAYRWRALTGRPRLEDELDEELRFHLEMEIERRMAAGESRERATRAARLEFGAPEAVKERVRDAWGVRLIDETGRDVRGAFRLLQKSPAFSLVALSSLSVGLSVAAVVFSLVDAVLLRPLPFEEPATLVSIEEVTPGGQSFSVSDPNLLDFGAMGESWSGVAGRLYQRPRPALEAGGERLLLEGELVTPSFFEVLGVEAQLGRTFSSASGDDSPREVVLTHGAFARYFGGAESIVGSAIDLDGEPWTVIGVLPPSFRYRKAARDLYMPLILSYASPRGDRRLEGLARLEEGVSLEQAAQELRGISSTLASIYPGSNDEWGVAMKPLDRFLLGEKTRHHQLMLLGAAALLLLLACANVSNLLLARGADRSDEIGLRLALGASRGRLRQQLMLESLVLGLVGGALAAALTLLAMPWVRSLDVDLPRLHEVSFGPRSALFLLLITLAASLLFGLISALRASGSAAAPRSRRQGSGVASARARSLLVMAEVALALMLAFGAGLLLRSFEQLQAFDAGLATGSGSVYLASIDLPAERYSQEDPSTQLFFDRLSDALAARPTIEAVGASMVNPFRGINTQNVVASELERDPKAFHQVRWRSVTPGFFDAAGATLLRGRTLGSRSRGPLETVISESLAERVWPGRNPIGERLRWRLPEGPLLEVVGVVADVEDVALGTETMPTMYWPQSAMGWTGMTLAMRTHEPAEAVAGALRESLAELDPLLAMPALETLEDNYRHALARPLLSLRLVALAAFLALAMAAAGVYGLVAYAVSQRRREMGVRAALGARPGQLVARVMRDAAGWIFGGLAAGLLASLGLMHSLRLLLYKTSPFDLEALATSVAVLALVGLLACAVPAARAGRIDSISALREE